MRIDQNQLKLYAITDERWLNNRSLVEVVQELIAGGVTCLQYRDKVKSMDEKEKIALQLKNICDQAQIPFIINDDVNLAAKIHADGVHLGQKDCDVKTARKILGERAIIGVSARTVRDALLAQENGADYLGSGAVFGTATKEDASFLGVDCFSKICEAVQIPVVAIGGISLQSIPQLKESGVSGVAVISQLFAAKTPQIAAQQFIQVINENIEMEYVCDRY